MKTMVATTIRETTPHDRLVERSALRLLGAAIVLALLSPMAVFAQDAHLHAVRVPDRLSHWPQSGFVEMVPPVRLPQNKSIHEHIMVWLRIPAGKKIGVSWLPDQKRYTLKFPPGTVADRIETVKGEKGPMQVVNGISDVRGARIDAKGRTWWHVYEPVPGGSSKWLKGYEWLRASNLDDNLAATQLVRLYFPGQPAKANRSIMRFRMTSHCTACHEANRPVPTTANKSGFTGAPETDADGFFQPITVLADSMTLFNVRPWDLNVGDPYISVWCGKHHATLVTRGDASRYYTCPNGKAPVGKLAMAAALKHKDPHALKVCAAREYLYKHMIAKGRQAFAQAEAECSNR